MEVAKAAAPRAQAPSMLARGAVPSYHGSGWSRLGVGGRRERARVRVSNSTLFLVILSSAILTRLV